MSNHRLFSFFRRRSCKPDFVLNDPPCVPLSGKKLSFLLYPSQVAFKRLKAGNENIDETAEALGWIRIATAFEEIPLGKIAKGLKLATLANFGMFPLLQIRNKLKEARKNAVSNNQFFFDYRKNAILIGLAFMQDCISKKSLQSKPSACEVAAAKKISPHLLDAVKVFRDNSNLRYSLIEISASRIRYLENTHFHHIAEHKLAFLLEFAEALESKKIKSTKR